jgi:uncharacterized delta-60 repeat protein
MSEASRTNATLQARHATSHSASARNAHPAKRCILPPIARGTIRAPRRLPMRTAVLGLVAIPAVCALTVECGGVVSIVPPGETDSGNPVPRIDAATPETDASVAPDSPVYADAVVPPDAPDDIAPNRPDAGPPACSAQLDPTFGVGGIATFVNPPYSRAGGIAFEPGGKMVVSMYDAAYKQDHKVAVARFDATGAIDAKYGDGGFARLVPLGSPVQDDEDPGQVLVRPDGKSLVVASDGNSPTLGRFDVDGTIDTSFGSNANGPGGGDAMPTTLWPNWWRVLALRDDGSILVGGSGDFTGGQTLFLAKYDRDGLVDTSFGAGGSVSDFSMGPCNSILAQPDGSFLVAHSISSGLLQPALTRYTASGALDVGFGSGGTATAPMNGGGVPSGGMATQSTGAIVVASGGSQFLAVRYTPGGQLDATFGNGGIASTDFFGAGDYAVGLSVLPDDSLLIAGTVQERTDAGHGVDFGVMRYTADGQPDTTFAPGGKLVTHFPQGGVDEVDAQGLQPDGKLVVAGYGVRGTDAGEEHILTLARYACR